MRCAYGSKESAGYVGRLRGGGEIEQLRRGVDRAERDAGYVLALEKAQEAKIEGGKEDVSPIEQIGENNKLNLLQDISELREADTSGKEDVAMSPSRHSFSSRTESLQ